MTFSLPPHYLQNLERYLSSFSEKELQKACESLTLAYQDDHNSKDYFQNPVFRASYLATRLPATFGCLKSVLSSLETKGHDTLLDLGSGPATTCGVLSSLDHQFKEIICYEQNKALFHEGLSLWDLSKNFCPSLELITSPLKGALLPKADLVIMSFFLGELPPSIESKVLQAAWSACKKTLVIIEPGTPDRFEKMRKYRETLLKQGGHIVGPCPHAETCPLTKPDWCHFCVKIERSRFHKLIKRASHPYELEKYSYLIMTKEPSQRQTKARLLRQPQKKPGHIVLDLCTPEGEAQRQTISKRDRSLYQIAKKYRWGDLVTNSTKKT